MLCFFGVFIFFFLLVNLIKPSLMLVLPRQRRQAYKELMLSSRVVDTILIAVVNRLSIPSSSMRSRISTSTRISGVVVAGDASVPVPSLVLGVIVGMVVRVGDVIVVSSVELVGLRVLGQHVALLAAVDDLAGAKDASEEAALSLAEAGGVVVLGTGAEALLLLVMASEGEFHEDGHGEEDDCDDGHGETGCLQSTSRVEAR